MSEAAPAVFISYSHRDEAWKDRLVGHLRVLEFEGALDVWDDRRIAAGDNWRPEIEHAIEHAGFAILIISKDFLTSRFIREEELTRILARRSRRELRVIPLIAEPCAWQAVGTLQGIQARPKDGRPLSAGTEHQIDEDLSALALEILDELQPGVSRFGRKPWGVPTTPAWMRSATRLIWLTLPSVVLALLALAATYWRLDTRMSLDVLARRVSFTLRGERPQDILNLSPQFSELTIERCSAVSFVAAEFRRVEPPGGRSVGHSGLTRFVCGDPAAKVTLANLTESRLAVGVLDRVVAEPKATVVLEVHGTTSPVLTLDVSTRQQLSLPIQGPVRIVAELTTIEPPFEPASSLSVYEARLSDTNRMIQVQTTDRGVVLVVTPTANSSASLLNERLPVEAVEFIEQKLAGSLATPFLVDASLRYPDYPDVPPLRVAADEFLVLRKAAGVSLRRVSLSTEGPPGLRLTVDGILMNASIVETDTGALEGQNIARSFDPRLTLFQTIRYRSRWNVVAAVAAWAMATTWMWYERWRKITV